ncbi:MAG: Lactoylglutathione lyase and related lyase [Herbinix sp.]|nr:Lactoylglutathione lyase and related lyase [Herbinix sp.]
MFAQKPEYPVKVNGTMELELDNPRFTEVDTESERIIQLGATLILEPTTTSWGQRTSFLADPDGNLIEIGSFGKND